MCSPRRTPCRATRGDTQGVRHGRQGIVNGLKNWRTMSATRRMAWQVDKSGFEVGVNMAATPGSVVTAATPSSDQYSPQTRRRCGSVAVLPAVDQQVLHQGSGTGQKPHRVGPARAYALDQLPQSDKSMSDLDSATTCSGTAGRRASCGDHRCSAVNTVSVCLGEHSRNRTCSQRGAGDDSIKSATFLNTHTDFTQPGCWARSLMRQRRGT
jgi:polyhydroxyalkanoate synthase